jgi:hypothetical protein
MSNLAVIAPSLPRLIAVRILVVAYALFVGLMSFGLPSLLTSWFTTGDELPLRTAYVVWGVLGGLLVPTLALALLRSRLARAACQALVGVVGACVIVLVAGFKAEHLVYLASVAVPALVLLALHPQTRSALRLGHSIDRAAMAIVAVMCVPAGWYAVDMALTSRATRVLDTPSGQFTLHGQYAQAAVLAFALVFVAAVGTLRQPGRRFLVALVAISAGMIGAAGVLFPQDLMSLGATWGTLTLAASAAYAVAGLRPAGQLQAASTPR